MHKLATHLNATKVKRYGSSHKSFDDVISCMERRPECIPQGSTEPPQAMSDVFRHDNPVTAYRLYYRHEKRQSWDNGVDRPQWMDVVGV